MTVEKRFLLGLLVAGVLTSGCNNGKTPVPENANTGTAGVEPVQTPDAALTTEQFQRALRLKNRGIGHLENKEWVDAEAALSELAELLPQNLLARRNLAVGRVLALIDRESPFKRSGSPENAVEFTKAVAAAETAIESYKQVATGNFDKALASLLRGKLLVHADSPEAATFEDGLQQLRDAADQVPEAADFRFALALAMDGHRDYTDPNSDKAPQLLRTLQQTFELAPQNLFALQKLMQRQALSLNSKTPETKTLALKIVETLQAAQKLLAPLNESIKQQRRMDLIATIDTALKNFDGSNTSALMGPAMMTGNLLLPEIATQIDQRRLNKDLLEYVVLNFDDTFMADARAAGALPEPEPTVVTAFVAADGLPDISGVTDVQLLDLNLDGFDDLVVAREGKVEVYSRGTDLTAKWNVMMTSPDSDIAVTQILLVDIDRDFDKAISDVKNPSLLRDADGDQKIPQDPAGKNRWYDTDPDVVGYGEGGAVVLRNVAAEDGTRSLVPVPQDVRVAGVNDVVAADLDADGDLDLVFATTDGMTLWKNIDGTVFQDMNDAATLPDHGLQSLSAVDWNQDVMIDIIGVGSGGEVGYLENMFHGRFRWLPLDITGSGTAFAIGDTNADGKWDYVSDKSADQTIVADLDNDGFADRITVGDGTLNWQRGTAATGFAESGVAFPGDVAAATLTVADVDDDGDLDIVTINPAEGTLQLLRNDGGNTNNWIDVVARAVPDDPQFPSNRVNMHAIGSVIELRAGGLYHAEVTTSPKVHLGLGKAEKADAIRIIWTDGIPQNVTVPELLTRRIGILAPQILKGSCPYIYTWTGERFEFFSDCLWAAPIGLVQATGEIAPTREWENLLIPGEALAEKDGRYVLQLTEELWEVAYFDHVRLTAIDHPTGVDIFTNEKVGPPSMAEHRIHSVRDAMEPASVTDGRGRDLLPGLKALDGNYVQAFEGRIMQGLTDEWTMEFRFDDVPEQVSPKASIRLFLIGWVFPTDTSLNVAISQNPGLAPPSGPSIEVPDSQGGWKVARPFAGFPSGKTKAMVVDISDIFGDSNSGELRFRIRSSMELYWDQAFLTLNESDADTVVQTCPLVTGDLQYRGFSRRTYADNALFRNGHAPESYDHETVTTEPRWPPISGRFTRYGETTELLEQHDDQMVVMGPGDALTLQFAVPEKRVPDGWKRDFVLMNVGYDKDADLNTIYGQSSEPFPFRAMSRYPFDVDDQTPNSTEYQQSIDKYQTRQYSPRPFWNLMRHSF
ncbi:MAG: FG-GAP-like repeat-containing protein [Planctomycetaceae bacterium]